MKRKTNKSNVGRTVRFFNKAHYPSLHKKTGKIVNDYGKKASPRYGMLFDGEERPMAVHESEIEFLD